MRILTVNACKREPSGSWPGLLVTPARLLSKKRSHLCSTLPRASFREMWVVGERIRARASTTMNRKPAPFANLTSEGERHVMGGDNDRNRRSITKISGVTLLLNFINVSSDHFLIHLPCIIGKSNFLPFLCTLHLNHDFSWHEIHCLNLEHDFFLNFPIF